MDGDKEIHATRDMIPELENDVMNEWEALFAQAQADIQDAAAAFRDEWVELDWTLEDRRASDRKKQAANKRQKHLAMAGSLAPLYRLAARLCHATHPLDDSEPTLTPVQAGRGWMLFDAMVEGFAEGVRGKKMSDDDCVQLRRSLLESVAKDIWRSEHQSLYNERDKGLKAWTDRYGEPYQPPMPEASAERHDDREFPAAWVMAVANGQMTPQEVATRWLAGEEPLATSDEPA